MQKLSKLGKVSTILEHGIDSKVKKVRYVKLRKRWKDFRDEMRESLMDPPDSSHSGKKVTKLDQVAKFVNKLKVPETYTTGLDQDIDKYSLGRMRDDVCRAI